MKTTNKAKWIRYAVSFSGQSMMCAQYTPKHFHDGKKKEAEAFAKSQGTIVVDLFKNR